MRYRQYFPCLVFYRISLAGAVLESTIYLGNSISDNVPSESLKRTDKKNYFSVYQYFQASRKDSEVHIVFLADLGKARGCSTNTFVNDQVYFVEISLRRRHALMVADGAFSHKIDYVASV